MKTKLRVLSFFLALTIAMTFIPAIAFADNPNTDVSNGDIDGEYTFTSEGERYGYESFLNSDWPDNYVGARMYKVTISDDGKLISEVSSDEITHMTIDIYSYADNDTVCGWELESESGVKGTRESTALPKGEYCVTFSYTDQPSSIIPYDAPGAKYFRHYISWKKEAYVPVQDDPSGDSSEVDPSKDTSEDGQKDESTEPSDTTDTTDTTDTKDTSDPSQQSDDEGEDAIELGEVVTFGGNTYTVISVESRTVAFTTAKNVKTVTIPASIKIREDTYSVTAVKAKAFAGSKATKLIVKSKKLTKKSVKGSLKGSKIKTVQVKVGTKKQNKTYVKKYKKVFTKANAGKKVTIK